MKKLDQVALAVMFLTGFLIACVIYAGKHAPIFVSCVCSTGCKQISPMGSVAFEFSRPVNSANVANLWLTDPVVEGVWYWSDDQHAKWKIMQPLKVEQEVKLQFVSGSVGQNGETINSANQWLVTVRPAELLAIGEGENAQEIFSLPDAVDAPPQQITQTGGKIYDYEPSPDGEAIAFSAINDQNGVDLWLVNRDGTDQRILLDCGADRCFTPSWSPVSNEIAYTRELAGIDKGGPVGAPRIWMLDFTLKKTSPLFTDSQMIGYWPIWSPDGTSISMWDGTNGGIQVVDRKSGESIILESSDGNPGSWSSDSQSLYYSNTIIGDENFRNVILQAEVKKGVVSTIFGHDGESTSFDNPVSNPVEGMLVVTIQQNIQNPNRELLLMIPKSSGGTTISDEPSTIPGFYSWTPDGDKLVFQLDRLGKTDTGVEIWIWERNTGKKMMVASNFRFPKWLP